jgi:NAD(P)-dependent dehydrogenase (short-subunit alcohol dehydrogenase family)
MTSLDGHVALITGGNSGIGLGMATGLARAGADLAIWGTNADKNVAAREELSALGVRVHAEVCDVADERAQEASFVRTVAALGKVDSVFACAGTTDMVPSITEMTLERWRRIMAINLDGAFVTLRNGARHLVERGQGGALVAVSSTAAIHGAPANPHYGAAKAGLLGLVRAMAVDLARHRIRVNALLPGWTDTPLARPGMSNEKFFRATVARTPVRRWADPIEYADVAVFLADPAITFHTGDTVVVDGGYTIF